MYQPYGTSINADVVLGICTGEISPGSRRFYNPSVWWWWSHYNPPRDWNRIPTYPRTGVPVPSVWLSPLESNHPGFSQVNTGLYTATQRGDRILIAYRGSGPPASLWSLAAYFADVARELGILITVHWAACPSAEDSMPFMKAKCASTMKRQLRLSKIKVSGRLFAHFSSVTVANIFMMNYSSCSDFVLNTNIY